MIKLSILISTLFERSKDLKRLMAVLGPQLTSEVEVLTLCDNRQRSTGSKFQILLNSAQGQYLTFIDDDDLVSKDFVSEVLRAIECESDVISYWSEGTLDGGNPFMIRSGLGNPIEQVYRIEGKWQDIKRPPFHWCTWKTSLARLGKFSDNYIDCDWFWLRQIIPLAQTEVKIEKPLHFYQYSSTGSRAAKGESSTNGTL